MSRGRRYSDNRKLNWKKVAAVIIVFVVIIMFVVMIKKMLSNENTVAEKEFPLAYFTVFTDDKWGVINSKGEIVIDPTYEEMIVIPDSTKDVFICTQNVDYEKGTYQTKVLDKSNVALFGQYDKVEPIENYDSNNELWYEKSVLRTEKDGLFGLIDLKGNELLKCEYQSIKPMNGIKNSIIVEKDDKFGVVDGYGTEVVAVVYKEVKPLTDQYEKGYIVVDEQGREGIVLGKQKILECKYESIANITGNDMYVVKENGGWKIINEGEEEFLIDYFQEVKSIDGDKVTIKKNDKYGVVSIDKTQIIPFEYDDVKYVFDDYYIVKKDGVYGVVNSKNEVKVELKYSKIIYRTQANVIQAERKDSYTSDLYNKNLNLVLSDVVVSSVDTELGYMEIRINNEIKYYNFNFEEIKIEKYLKDNTVFVSKQDGKYGFVNKDGVVVVDYKYDDATEQNKYGFAAVKLNGKWGAIDSKGNVVVEPKYTLDKNVLIDFIGQWHICEDLNAYYYTK